MFVERRRHADQDDSGRCRQAEPNRKLPEVLVKRDHDSAFGLGPSQDLIVTTTRSICSNPNDIVTGSPERNDGRTGYVLIGDEPHYEIFSG